MPLYPSFILRMLAGNDNIRRKKKNARRHIKLTKRDDRLYFENKSKNYQSRIIFVI